ncbi:MAG: HAD-IA family hydrolase [Alphaproteobacteria bacterium]|nr:HAD-IA family hydrolase [Alphaproteobacteria bacterium]
MFENKKVVIWDLDNTLYRITPEIADMLDETMAVALVEDLHVPLELADCKALVKESYKQYRDGGEYFYQNYNISPKDLSFYYNKRNPVHMIEPYQNLALKLKQIPLEQYVFTASNRQASERILKRIGLYEMFKDRFFSVEDFGVYKKNENADVYHQYCQKIGYQPTECIFVDDSYSNLEFAKETGMTTIRIYYQNNSASDKEYIDAAFKGVEQCIEALIDATKKEAV